MSNTIKIASIRQFGNKIVDRVRYQLLGLERSEREIVIGIGLSRTGTTSLISALEILGYTGLHYPPIVGFRGDDPYLDWPWWMARFNALSDIPCAILFRELDKKFPNAKFILTTREQSSWIDSCERLFTKQRAIKSKEQPRFARGIKTHEFLFESHTFDRAKYIDAYNRHLESVLSFFSTKPEKLLVYALTGGDGWQPLCGFLSKPLPSSSFPISNRFLTNEGSHH